MATMTFAYRVGLLLFFSMPLIALAETVYINDKVTVGLHQDKDVDSAITKTLTSGTALEVLKRDTPLTQVKEPAGTIGWIDNRYLADAAPGRSQLLQLQEKAGKLEAELSALKANSQNISPSSDADAQKFAMVLKENQSLQQQLQSEQLKAGELQAQASELRNQLSQAGARERSTVETDSQATSGITMTGIQDKFGFITDNLNWRTILAGMAVCIVIGLIGGAWLMDWAFRRRHGGFRI